jgi:hypothetical protein
MNERRKRKRVSEGEFKEMNTGETDDGKKEKRKEREENKMRRERENKGFNERK